MVNNMTTNPMNGGSDRRKVISGRKPGIQMTSPTSSRQFVKLYPYKGWT